MEKKKIKIYLYIWFLLFTASIFSSLTGFLLSLSLYRFKSTVPGMCSGKAFVVGGIGVASVRRILKLPHVR